MKWAELYSYMDVQEMTWKRKRLLSLMAAMDNYSCLLYTSVAIPIKETTKVFAELIIYVNN